MSLPVSHLFISNPYFIGVIKSEIIKEFHDIKLKIEFHKILTNDKKLTDMVCKSCQEDHTCADALKLVSSEMIYSKTLNYNDSETFKNYLSFIQVRNLLEDQKTNKMWNIKFKFNKDIHHFTVGLSSNDVSRLFSQVNSYYSNYMFFAALAKENGKTDDKIIKKEDKKITDYIKSNGSIIQDTTQDVVINNEAVKERNDFSDIFELCLNSTIKSSLIHYTFSYFRFFDNKQVNLTYDKDQVKINLPILVPSSFNFDENYFRSLILSNSSIHLNSVTYAVKKILSNLLTNYVKYRESPICILMISYLLFIYLLRCFYESNKDSFRIYFHRIVCEPTTQTAWIMKLIQSNFSEFFGKISFQINPSNLAEINEGLYTDQLNKLSSEYKHLIPVSQEEFANKVFNNIEDKSNNLPVDFRLTGKRVIDVTKIIENNQIKLKSQSILFDPEKTLVPSENSVDNEFNYLDYNYLSNNGSKIISKQYSYLLNYIKDPSTLLLLNERELPKEIVSMFDVISKKILNRDVLDKENTSTFKYYEILTNSLPNSKLFKHSTMLYIIYRLIVPFYFDVYNNNTFYDVFL